MRSRILIPVLLFVVAAGGCDILFPQAKRNDTRWQVAFSRLPETVQQGVWRDYPGGKINANAVIQQDAKGVAHYHVTVTTREGKTVVADYNERGEKVSEQAATLPGAKRPGAAVADVN